MTDELFDQRIRRWYRQEVGGDAGAPDELRAAVADIPTLPDAGVAPSVRSTLRLLAVAAVIAALSVIGALVAGSVITHVKSVATPAPSAPATILPPPTPTPSPTPAPTPSPVPTASPVVVPGGLIAVYHGLGNTAEVLTFDPVSGEQVVLGTVDVSEIQLRSGVYADVDWSTDRRRVTISRVGDGLSPQAQFDVVNLNVTPITNHIGESYISPDGQKVAGIDVFGDQENAPTGIFVVDFAGSVLQQIELPAGGGYITRLSWAPDSSAIVVTGYLPAEPVADGGSDGALSFAATAAGPAWVWLVPLNGNPIQSFGGLAHDTFGLAQLSPDMSTIAASLSCDAPCEPGLIAIDVASGEITPLTTNPNDVFARWSPDGSRIAFARTGGTGRGLWVMNADGSDLTRLTSPGRPDRDHDLAWSPDGASLIFSRGDTSKTGLGDLYLVPATGGEPQLLLTNAVGDW
jgi:Tol biopolymer transport system component